VLAGFWSESFPQPAYEMYRSLDDQRREKQK